MHEKIKRLKSKKTKLSLRTYHNKSFLNEIKSKEDSEKMSEKDEEAQESDISFDNDVDNDILSEMDEPISAETKSKTQVSRNETRKLTQH